MSKDLHFYKFESTGNDFILLDCREYLPDLTEEIIRMMCHRRFGIGADGLILFLDAADHDFRMVYYNSDGREGTFCGNGGRAITAFADLLGVGGDHIRFLASDGSHTATLKKVDGGHWWVTLAMQDTLIENPELINTGSPHHVLQVDDIESLDLEIEGPALRHHYRFGPDGCNVNFTQFSDNILHVRTFERGVEAETLSCGTGVTASAIFHHANQPDGSYKTSIHTRGGTLEVAFEKRGLLYTQIMLSGPTRHVFSGKYYL